MTVAPLLLSLLSGAMVAGSSPATANVTMNGVSVSTTPPYMDPSGNVTSSLIDSARRQVVVFDPALVYTVGVTGLVSGGLTDTELRASPVPVSEAVGMVDPNNSTTVPLAGGATFTGAWVDTVGYASVAYSIQSDVISAVGGIMRQWSQDGVNPMYWTGDSLSADRTGVNNGTDMMVRNHARYFRVVYTNGASAQSYFRLQSILYRSGVSADTIGVDHVPLSGQDALITKSVIAGKSSAGGGTYVDVKVSPSGAIQTEASVAVDTTPSFDASGTATTASLVVAGGVKMVAMTLMDPSTGTTIDPSAIVTVASTSDWDGTFSTDPSGLSTSTTLTQIVAASGTNRIIVKNAQCSASVASTTTTDQQCDFYYGTGTNCATGTTASVGCFQPALGGCNTQEFVVPAGQALCWIHAAAGSKRVHVTYRYAQ